MRWLMIALCIFGFALAFVTKSPAVLGLGILIGSIGLFGAVFSIAADKVSSAMRPEGAILDPETVARLRERASRPAAPAPARPQLAAMARSNEPPQRAS